MAVTKTPTKKTSSTAPVAKYTQKDCIDAIVKSKAKPLYVENGTAIELANRLKTHGNKKVSIIVLI